jgi:hypothetical protein
MPTALVWKYDPADRFSSDLYTAHKSNAVRGQYRIWPLRDTRRFRVSHRCLSSKTGELSERVIGDADTFDSAKAIAQAHADQYGREKSAA